MALWILGAYSETDAEVTAALHTIRECIGPLPLTMGFADFAVVQSASSSSSALGAGAGAGAEASDGGGAVGSGSSKAAGASSSSKPVVLADGTYATQSGLTVETNKTVDADEVSVPSLRRHLLAGDFYLASVVASTLTKLALRVCEHHGRESNKAKAVIVDAMLVMCAIVELGSSGLAGTSHLLPASLMPCISGRTYGSSRPAPPPPAPVAAPGTPLALGGSSTLGALAAASSNGVRIDQDSFERVVLCMRVLGDPQAAAATMSVLLHTCRDAFRGLLAERRSRAQQAARDGVAGASSSGIFLSTPSSGSSSSLLEEKKSDPGYMSRTAPEEVLSIRQLRGKAGGAAGG